MDRHRQVCADPLAETLLAAELEQFARYSVKREWSREDRSERQTKRRPADPSTDVL